MARHHVASEQFAQSDKLAEPQRHVQLALWREGVDGGTAEGLKAASAAMPTPPVHSRSPAIPLWTGLLLHSPKMLQQR
jgi:hypothetical protein